MVAQAAPHRVLTRRFYPSIILPMQVPSLRDTAEQAWAAVPLLASSPTMKDARDRSGANTFPRGWRRESLSFAAGIDGCHNGCPAPS
jgi:hypothetical protein